MKRRDFLGKLKALAALPFLGALRGRERKPPRKPAVPPPPAWERTWWAGNRAQHGKLEGLYHFCATNRPAAKPITREDFDNFLKRIMEQPYTPPPKPVLWCSPRMAERYSREFGVPLHHFGQYASPIGSQLPTPLCDMAHHRKETS